jgi:hypothetical protein
MSIDTIDAAILAHRAWVGGFKSACKGISTETFDLARARDFSSCALGRWLSSEAAQLQLGVTPHEEICSLHRSFHETAGTIAERLNRGQMQHETQVLIAQFDELSKELIKLLRLSKQKN